jgi:exoribonuclease R
VPRRLDLTPPDAQAIQASLAKLRSSFGVSLDFPGDVVAEAEEAAQAASLPDVDETEIPFVTIDPPESMDLDQAVHLERRDGGYRVRYAIADVASFVTPGGVVDAEAHARGQTFYAPDADARLYPQALSEGAASLLPGEVRPALVWTMDLDETSEGVAVHVRRARVRSRRKLDYAGVQRALDEGTADEAVALLPEIGRLRQERQARVGGVDLPIPDQEVELVDGSYRLSFRAPLPVEDWNAQISILTGQAAALLMLRAKVGILRTLPQGDDYAVGRLRRTAAALGVPWPEEQPFPDFLRGLDASIPAHAAVLSKSTVLLRGSGYAAFDGDVPEQPKHAGIGAPYAHTTAPLRRLVDRYVGETCVAISAGTDVPGWVRSALPDLPETMEDSNRRNQGFESGLVSLVEAAVLAGSVGQVFEAVVIDADKDGEGGSVQLAEPAVTARCSGRDLPLGHRLDVRLVTADVEQRLVRFEPA